MKRIQQTFKNSIVIQKSEFITHLFRVNSLEDVEFFLEQTKKKYYDATHNCYAYILGNSQEIQKCSDDGEPQKTAGFPMLDVLKKNDLTDILAITTRYFGGILLGAGGLVRAYSSSVSECLKTAILFETKKQIKFILTLSYAGYNTLIKVIPYLNIIESSFATNVHLIATIDVELYPTLENELYKNKIAVIELKKIETIDIEIPI